jgi:hypothetical protein
MKHDAERLAAAYLTTMRRRGRRRYEAHLLACEPCWREVCLARRGRQLAEASREAAPPGLRDDIRAAVTAAATAPADRPRARSPIALAVAITLAVVAGATMLTRPWHYGPPVSAAAPPVVVAAVASYRDNRLPGTAVPGELAPDLTGLSLHLVGAATGQLDGMPVTTFTYLNASGARLAIYRSTRPFPEAAEAHALGGEDSAWTMRSSGITVICAQGTHTTLLLGSDAALVKQAGAALHAT